MPNYSVAAASDFALSCAFLLFLLPSIQSFTGKPNDCMKNAQEVWYLYAPGKT